MKNNRIIINNYTELSDLEAMQLVLRIIEQGKISNDGKQYVYATRVNKKQIICAQRKSGYSFMIYKEEQENE